MDVLSTDTIQRYLRAIYQLTERDQEKASTTQIATLLGLSGAAVTEMLSRLATQQLIAYAKYHGAQLTTEGRRQAVQLVRSQRIWETFLYQRLKMSWVDVADEAIRLSAASSAEATRRLSILLDQPKWSPYGDPIPNEEGKISIRTQTALTEVMTHQPCTMLAIKRKDRDFLDYLTSIDIAIGREIMILDRQNYEGVATVSIKPTDTVHMISAETCRNLLVRKI